MTHKRDLPILAANEEFIRWMEVHPEGKRGIVEKLTGRKTKWHRIYETHPITLCGYPIFQNKGTEVIKKVPVTNRCIRCFYWIRRNEG